jgi:cytochrome oxidase Cu insertion factor (SCO1/SenC/PrrC family)
MMRRGAWLMLAFLAIPMAGSGQTVKRIPPEDLAIGKVAPDIVGEDIDGKAFKLSDYRGKVVVIDFWGHW